MADEPKYLKFATGGDTTASAAPALTRQRELDISGKVIIITGASRGVGKQAALDFARRGAKLVLAARTVNPDPTLPGTIGETLRQVEELGGQATAVAIDLAEEAELKRLVDTAVERFGGIDILVNNAAATTGDVWGKSFLGTTRQEWLYQFDVNVHAPFTLTQLVVPIMEKRGGGRIINLTTGCAENFRQVEQLPNLESTGEFAGSGYYASKRALDRFASCLAPELSRKNIAVIGMNPGMVATELVAIRVAAKLLDDSIAVPMTVPSRMIVYFAACEDPWKYTGRMFLAEREMVEMGIPLDIETVRYPA